MQRIIIEKRNIKECKKSVGKIPGAQLPRATSVLVLTDTVKSSGLIENVFKFVKEQEVFRNGASSFTFKIILK